MFYIRGCWRTSARTGPGTVFGHHVVITSLEAEPGASGSISPSSIRQPGGWTRGDQRVAEREFTAPTFAYRRLRLSPTFASMNAVLGDPQMTRLRTRKNFNADFLFTYLINPWSALNVGYNSNNRNVDLIPIGFGSGIVTSDDFLHDSRQFFVKFSYLFQY